MVITQIVSSFQIIYDVLEKVEVAITFSKLNTFHNSIVDPENILNEITNISTHFKKRKFPFEPTLDNVILLEKVTEVKSYVKNDKIIFILEIPIVEIESYDYYRLYPLPTCTLNTFKTIIPHSKYLITNKQHYAFSDTNCLEIKSGDFLCRELHTTNIKSTGAPCEIELLKYSTNVSTCEQIPVIIEDIQIEKIKENQWIVITPHSVVAIKKCKDNSENIPLNGSYLIELNSDCEVTIEDNYIRIYKSVSNKNKFKNINLPKIILNNIKINYQSKFKPLKLKPIDLNGIKHIYKNLNEQSKILDKINKAPIYYNRTSIYTILLYILIIIVVIILTFYYLYQRKDAPPCENTIVESTTLTSQIPPVPTRTLW